MKSKINFSLPVTMLMIMLLASLLPGGTGHNIAFVIKVNGTALVKKEPKNWQKLESGTRLDSGDKIKTGAASLVALVFTDDKSMIKIRSDSYVVINGEPEEKSIVKRLVLNAGEIWAKINPAGGNFRMETPVGIAAVKGTEFYGIIDSEGNLIIIGIEGLVELNNKLGKILVGKGETGRLAANNIPTKYLTDQFDDWARKENSSDEIEFEFKDAEGNTKYLKLEFKNK